MSNETKEIILVISVVLLGVILIFIEYFYKK